MGAIMTRFQGLAGFFALVTIATLAVACSSKYSENAPTGEAPPAVSLEARVALKVKSNTLLDRASRSVVMTKSIATEASGLTQSSDSSSRLDQMAMFDIITDLMQALEQPLPSMRDGTMITEAKTKLTIDGLDDGCQVVSARLELKSAPDSATSSHPAILGSISLQTCSSAGQFVRIIEITDDGESLSFKFDADHLLELFRTDTSQVENLGSNCKATFTTAAAVQKMVCENLTLQVGGTVPGQPRIAIESVSYYLGATTGQKMEFIWALLESGVVTLRQEVSVDQGNNITRTALPLTDSSAQLSTPAPTLVPTPVPTPAPLPSPTPFMPLSAAPAPTPVTAPLIPTPTATAHP